MARSTITYKEIKTNLKTAPLLATYLFLGEEDYLKKEIVSEIKRYIFKNSEEDIDFNYNLFYGDETNVVSIVNTANSFPFFTPKRLIILKRVEGLSTKDKAILCSYIENPCKTTCLILIATASKLDKTSLIYQTVLKKGQIINFYRLFDNEVKSWLMERCKRGKKKITSGAIELLLQRIGNSLQELEMETNKLISFIGEKETLTEEDIIKASGESYQATVFDLGAVIGERKQDKSIKILKNLLLQGEAPVKILFMIARHLRLLWQAKLLQEQGVPQIQIASSLKIWSKKEQATLFNQIKSFSHLQLSKAFEALLETDLDLKSKDSKTYLVIMERLIYKLTKEG